jgi:alpha-L-fucosidase
LLKGDKKTAKLNFTKEGIWTVIQAPYQPADPMISVIEITPKKNIQVDPVLAVDPEFGLELSVVFSKQENCSVKKKSWMEKFGEWKHLYQISDWSDNSRAVWEFDVPTPGKYLIELTYSGNGPRVWSVESGEGKKIQNRQNSSSIRHTQPIGWIKFDKAGRQTITVTIPEGERTNTHLSAIKITPIDFY